MTISTAQPKNIIYCITCILCSKLENLAESGRKLGEPFPEYLLDVIKAKDHTCVNPWQDISVSQAIHTNTQRFAELTCTKGTMNSRKKRTENHFQTRDLGSHGPTESRNEFYSHSFKHIFDQLDAINFNLRQCLPQSLSLLRRRTINQKVLKKF